MVGICCSYLLIFLFLLRKFHPAKRTGWPPFNLLPSSTAFLSFLSFIVLYIAVVIVAQFAVQIPWDGIPSCARGESNIWADWLCPMGLYHYPSGVSFFPKFATTYAMFVFGSMALRLEFNRSYQVVHCIPCIAKCVSYVILFDQCITTFLEPGAN